MRHALTSTRTSWTSAPRPGPSLRLLSLGNFDVRLQRWEHESIAGWHDHGGSSGAFTVTVGELAESFERPESARTASPSLLPGRVASFGPNYVHEVTHVAGTPALSVHAYAPPLEKMTHYDRTSQGFIVTATVFMESWSTVPGIGSTAARSAVGTSISQDGLAEICCSPRGWWPTWTRRPGK